ncbi:Rgp1p [Ascoidea rubescens DSM 1968]|uniref:Rgp1-domain-containing protein n=1 Tax=Ascoidea rubescens DSM 1968 TaxID=1344418 RepID=A0A1D2VK91_9ASCO|nr:Rgp1-domain-containing protein [Ascoidea rubescens DSM 1968]ODV62013.1 Rgp1-domain-containing protein [Ascoidea rubescens DSM 1968]
MIKHSIFNQQLTPNIRVEVVYESNPFYAGESVSAIIRFRHLGKEHNTTTQSSLPETRTENASNNALSPTTAHQSSLSWSGFGRRISSQFSNSARSSFLDQLDKDEGEPSAKVKPLIIVEQKESLLLGNIQLFGYFLINRNVVDDSRFDDLKKKSTIGGRIAGIQSLESSKSNLNGGLFSNLTYILSNIDNLFPVFSTEQSLLFTEITLHPGEVKQYYYKFKIPETLPPSYKGNFIKINYNLILNCEKLTKNSQPRKLNIYFPLKIYPFTNPNQVQPFYDLNSEFLNNFKYLKSSRNRGVIVDLNDSKNLSLNRRSSFISISNFIVNSNLANSAKKTENSKYLRNSNSNQLKKSFIKKIKILIDDKDFITSEKINNYKEEDSILNDFKTNTFKGCSETQKLFYPSVLRKPFQSQFLIKYNKHFVSKLTLSKSYYEIGSQIHLIFDFDSKKLNDDYYKATGLVVNFESFENNDIQNQRLFKEFEELTLNDEVLYKEFSQLLISKSYSVIDYNQLNLFFTVPYSISPQFESNIFRIQYYINLKFIIIKKNDERILDEIYNDNKGELFLGRDSINGFEFNCKIPINIISSYEDFGGTIYK